MFIQGCASWSYPFPVLHHYHPCPGPVRLMSFMPQGNQKMQNVRIKEKLYKCMRSICTASGMRVSAVSDNGATVPGIAPNLAGIETKCPSIHDIAPGFPTN